MISFTKRPLRNLAASGAMFVDGVIGLLSFGFIESGISTHVLSQLILRDIARHRREIEARKQKRQSKTNWVMS